MMKRVFVFSLTPKANKFALGIKLFELPKLLKSFHDPVLSGHDRIGGFDCCGLPCNKACKPENLK